MEKEDRGTCGICLVECIQALNRGNKTLHGEYLGAFAATAAVEVAADLLDLQPARPEKGHQDRHGEEPPWTLL